VGICQFFFSNLRVIHYKYKEFFGSDPEDEQVDTERVEDATEIPKTEMVARFYFSLTYLLSGEDITKFEQIDNTSIYLCLNTAALIKDRIELEKRQIEKMKQR